MIPTPPTPAAASGTLENSHQKHPPVGCVGTKNARVGTCRFPYSATSRIAATGRWSLVLTARTQP